MSDLGIRKWLYPALIALAVLVAYRNCFDGLFLLDDYPRIVENRRLLGWRSCVVGSSRPLVDLTFRLNLLAGGKAADFHLVNLGIHLLAALALYGVVRRVGASLGAGSGTASGFGACVAVLWGVHPLNTESVTYLVQRAESLMGLWLLFTVYAFLRGVALGSEPGAGRWRGVSWLAVSVAACGLGMASKATMVVAPLVVLVCDRVCGAGGFLAALRARGLYYGCLAGTLVIAGLALVGGTESSSSVGTAPGVAGPLGYAATQVEVLQHYVRLAFFPVGLCFDYGWADARFDFLWGVRLAGLLAGLGVLVAALLAGKRAGWLMVVFLLLLAPTSSFFPIADRAAEHRMYLPLAVLLAWFLLGLRRWVGVACGAGAAGGFGRVFFCVVAVSLLALLTRGRNEKYASEEALWRDTVERRPANLRARNELALLLGAGGRYGEAEEEFARVLGATAGVKPRELREDELMQANSMEYNRFRAFANRGLMRMVQGDRAGALRDYEEALRIEPRSEDVRAKRARAVRHDG